MRTATRPTNDPVHDPKAPRPMLVDMFNLPAESVRWLWPGRIPLGKVTLLAGDPGLGKSFLTLDIAARLSRGLAMPGCENPPASWPVKGRTILVSGEDDPSDTIKPRLHAAGAELGLVLFLSGVRFEHNGRDSEFYIDRDIAALRQAVRDARNCRLIVIDPISAFLLHTDANSNADVRRVLRALATLAAECRVAVLCVTHLNKNAQGRAAYRASGSLAFSAAARAVYYVARDPDDPERRLLLPVKANVNALPTGISYRIADGRVEWDTSAVMISADEADDQEAGARSEALTEAVDFLRTTLSDGPIGAGELRERAESAGLPWITIRRAKRRLGVRSNKASGARDGAWMWSLPGAPASGGALAASSEGAHPGPPADEHLLPVAPAEGPAGRG